MVWFKLFKFSDSAGIVLIAVSFCFTKSGGLKVKFQVFVEVCVKYQLTNYILTPNISKRRCNIPNYRHTCPQNYVVICV